MNELRVFISSTFRDLQEEREHLVKKTFPKIRSLCRERGVVFTEVDLRWGLTEDEGTYGRIIRTCLEEVDRCRPYFIGITGNRYGYIPEYLDIQKDPELLRLYPWVEDAVLDELSITAMEIKYGVLDDPGAASGARFYFRREPTSQEEEQPAGEADRLRELKERIRSSGASAKDFIDPASLGEIVYEDLLEIIDRDFADARPPTPLETERSKHEAFAASRRRAYIANPLYLKRLNEWRLSDPMPLVIYAESGSGKSSLISFWCEQLRRREPELFVVEHYVGIGAGDSDHLGLIRHIMLEIKERFGRDEELPAAPEQIERGLGVWLGYASDELRRQGLTMVLVLDGLNQLRGTSLSLRWIPDVIAPELRLIATSTVEETLVGLRKRGWTELGMQPLREAECEAVVVRFLSEYRKTLPGTLVKLIARDPKSAHALFLRTLLEELRLFGEHEGIERHVEHLLSSTGTEDLFQRVLERLEQDHGPHTAREAMTLLWASRGGLSEEELSELTDISRLKLSTLLLGFDYHLVRRDGLLTFFHDYLRRAIEKRYLPDEASTRSVHLHLAEYFEKRLAAVDTQNLSHRESLELLHQLRGAGERERLAETLSRVPMVMTLFRGETEYDVLRYWSWLGDGFDVEELHRAALASWRSAEVRSDRVLADVLGRVANVLHSVNKWRGAITLLLERIELSMKIADPKMEADARRSLGVAYMTISDYQAAFDEFDRSRKICEESGDRVGAANAVGHMGLVYSSRGDYESALNCYRQREETLREIGDRRALAGVLHNIALVYSSMGRFGEAMSGYEEALTINESVGNRLWMGANYMSMGQVHCLPYAGDGFPSGAPCARPR